MGNTLSMTIIEEAIEKLAASGRIKVIQAFIRTKSPQNLRHILTKSTAPAQRQLVDKYNLVSKQATGTNISQFCQIQPSISQRQLVATAMQSARRTPMVNTINSLKYKIFEGLQSNGLPHFFRPSIYGAVAEGKYIPKAEINFTTPGWWWRQIAKKYSR